MKRLARLVLLLPALVVGGAVVVADTVQLRSGSRIEGDVLEESDTSVKLQVATDAGKSVISIDRAQVVRIEKAPSFASRLESAQKLLAEGQAPSAEDAYRELMREEPRHAGARMGAARAMVANYKHAEALKTLEHYLELVPEGRSPDLLMLLAERYLYAREYRDARKTAREAAQLAPDDKALQQAEDEFAKRVDRVRAGYEQLEDRRTKELAERNRLMEARASFDQQVANNKEAQDAGQMLLDWTAAAQPRMIISRFVEVTAPAAALEAYRLGSPERDLQREVTRATLKVQVDEAIWTSLYDHQKAMYIYGWYYQLRDRYPKTFPDIKVVSEVEERGRKTEKELARGSWDGRREWVTIDRRTKENRDPTRPIRGTVK